MGFPGFPASEKPGFVLYIQCYFIFASVLYDMTFGFSKEIVMGIPHSNCESCAKLCEDAKVNVKNLEKKIYTLTIVCTSAITLLGEQAAKALISSITNISSAMSIADGIGSDGTKNTQPEEQKEENKQTNSIGGWKPIIPKFSIVKEEKEQVKKYELVDELSKLGEEKPKEPIEIIVDKPNQNIPTKELLTQKQEKTSIEQITTLPQVVDTYSLFFTPSALPFDVYSNTLALGTNYGFGSFYGVNTGGVALIPPIPDCGTFSVFALSSIINTRKRV